MTPQEFVKKIYPDAICENISNDGPFSYYQITIKTKTEDFQLGTGGSKKFAWQDAEDFIINERLEQRDNEMKK